MNDDKALARPEAERLWASWAEMWNGSISLATHIIAPRFSAHLTHRRVVDPADLRDPETVARWVASVRNQYESLRYETRERVLVDGDSLAARWQASGVFAGKTGQPHDKAGKPFRIAGTDVLRVESGRIAECWTLSSLIEL